MTDGYTEVLRSRGLRDEAVIEQLAQKVQPKTKLRCEMYDKVNYMCRSYMDRIARIRLDYSEVPNIEAFKTTLLCFFEMAPVMHSSFVDNHINPYWHVSDYNVEDIFSCFEAENLDEAANHFLLNTIPLTGNVQMRVGLFTHRGKCAICFAWNHMCMDAGEFKRWYAEFCINYNLYAVAGVSPLRFRTGTRAYTAVYDDMSKEDAAKAKRLFASVSAHDKHALPLTPCGEHDRNMIISSKVESDVFEAAVAAAKKINGTANDVIAAAYISAFYAVSGCPRSERVGISCAVDLRRHIKNIEKTGYTNHTTFMPCVVDGAGENIGETLKRVVESTSQVKSDKFLGLHGLPLLNIGYSTMVYAQAELVIKSFYTNANLSVSNVGVIDARAFSLDDVEPDSVLVAGAAKNKPCALMTAVTLNGRLTLSICIRGGESDKKLLNGFLDCVVDGIKEISQL